MCVPSVPPRLGLAPREDHPGELVDLVKDSGREQEAAARWSNEKEIR